MSFEKLPAVEFTQVRYSKADWVATITLDRPEAYNAYSTRALIELAAAFKEAAFDDEVAVIVYTGSGTTAFCTGGDVKEYEREYTKSPHNYWKYMGLFSAYIESIINSGKPVIARLNGMAVGGGNESQLACDLSIIAEHGYVGQVGTKVGSVAAGGATQWLPIVVGDRRAREILLLNKPIDAYKALEWGLVNQVVPSVVKDGGFIEHATPEQISKAKKGQDGYSISLSKLDEAVSVMATELIDKFPECTRYTKQQVNFWKDLAWHQTVGHARDWLSIHYSSFEPIEGMNAFVEKRQPGYRMLRERAASGGSSEFPWGPYGKSCPACGARFIPSQFTYCGNCGSALGGLPNLAED
ncbi:MAG: enoyl-CoA hydratase-related protein [Actinomycetota bacterium]|jgi:enoyl-CoA hydratase/carnithine racemase|nr:enoyl-CoA hydratase-related protein [Actinomycetota bacterium]